MLTDYRENKALARQIKAKTTAAIDAIRRNGDLSEAAKARDIEQLKKEQAEKMAELRAAYYDGRDAHRENLYRDLFSIPKGADAESYRKAIDRARAAKTETQLATILKTANRTDDAVLKQAVAFVANESGSINVAREALHANDHETYNELRQIENETLTQRMADKIEFSLGG